MKKWVVVFSLLLAGSAWAQSPTEAEVRAQLPKFERYVEKSRLEWKVPSVAVAVVYHDKLLWWKGFGDRGGGVAGPPDLNTVYAVGSTTKAFCATTQAMMVDGGGPGWDSKVCDSLPDFQMGDPWVTREMQVDDLLAQHPGIAPQALSSLAGLDYSAESIVAALRWVEPVSSFRSQFSYVNALHIVAGQMVAKWAGESQWHDVLKSRILQPLGMTRTSWTAQGLDGEANRAPGHAYVKGKIHMIPAGPFPYNFGPAGALNSTLADMSRWVRLQLGKGEFEGKRLVSEENLQVTWTPHTVLNSENFYCLGWILHYWHGHSMLWHNGGTPGHTTFVGIQPDQQLGIVVLSNLGDTQLPDALGFTFFESVYGTPRTDYSSAFLKRHEQKVSERVAARIAPVGAAPSPSAAVLSGTYDCAALGDLSVENRGGETYLRFRNADKQAHLIPHDGMSFRLVFEDGWMSLAGWDEAGSVLFTTNTEGAVEGLKIRLGEPGEGAVLTAKKQ